MPTVSVVMPAYNADKYIAQAFDSLIAQTFSDWECVVVNDGSTDGTLAIIESYAARDPRFVYTTIPNSGSAKIPRDTAIEMATTEWIMSLDADDYLDADVLEKLVVRQAQMNADIVLLRLDCFDELSGQLLNSIPVRGFNFDQVVSGKEAMMMTVGGWQIPGNGLLKRDILLANSHKNMGVTHLNADEYTTRRLLAMVRKVAFADVSYHYRICATSVTRNVSPKLFDTVITDRMVAELVGREFGADSPQFRKAKTIAIDAVLGKYFDFARYTKQFSAENRQKVDALIRTERKQYSRAEILGSDISFVHKALLTLPRWMAMISISMSVSLKKR